MNLEAQATDPEGAAIGPALYDEYRNKEGIFDEFLDAQGARRPHWQALISGLEAMASSELAHRWEKAQQLIHENGITYNVYADPKGMERPWPLDLLPLVLSAGEWQALERGLIQRARLLNAILTDLYGPQRLLTEGLLPAPLVLGNPHFLRPCHGIPVPGGSFLQFYAVDVARAPDGRWWVLSDRTQAPSGAGYALENRVIISRVLPDLFRRCQVHRLAGFFRDLRDRLLALARREDPRIVLLTPGPYNETYFEHAYLARYLGFTLVEGGDLTVRDDRVYLKTIDGLKQVDVIMRRLDAEFCDPLELRADSTLGVPGLVQAVRAGNVVMANALGSGLLECEALMGFLPGLCRHVLGEDLRIPCIATWWCGQERARADVLDNLDNLVINPTFGSGHMLSATAGQILGAQLSAEQRTALVERMERRGYDYVGQELASLSTTPVWAEGRLQPGPMALRAYLAAVGDSFVVMPGGLTRVSAADDARAVSMQRGDGSKDTWVLSERPVAPVTLLGAARRGIRLRRTGRDLPSRAADNMFWLGRYAERAENKMRFLRSLLARLTEDTGPLSDTAALEKLLDMLVEQGQVPSPAASCAAQGRTVALEKELWVLLYAPDAPHGLYKTLRDLHGVAAVVRDRLSADAWRNLNRLHADGSWREPAPELEIADALALLNDSLRTMAAFSGMAMENMTRSYGWRFLDMGRRLERALHTVGLLRGLLTMGDAREDGVSELLLELADSFMTYRSRYLTTPELAGVLDLLLVDETNPRSVAFQVVALSEHADSLVSAEPSAVCTTEQRIIMALLTDLRLVDVHRLSRRNRGGRRAALSGLLERAARDLPELSNVIARSYFSHAERIRVSSALYDGSAP